LPTSLREPAEADRGPLTPITPRGPPLADLSRPSESISDVIIRLAAAEHD
jgi:hypothetical protein